MNRLTLTFILAAGLAMAGASQAQETRIMPAGAQPAPAGIDALKGIVGNWTTASGAAAYSAPVGGEIVGHLVLTDDKGAPRVQELWILKPENGSLTLRQKIIDGPLSEREPMNVFDVRRLVAIEGGKLYFENMTFEPKGDTLTITVNRPIGLLKIDLKRVK